MTKVLRKHECPTGSSALSASASPVPWSCLCAAVGPQALCWGPWTPKQWPLGDGLTLVRAETEGHQAGQESSFWGAHWLRRWGAKTTSGSEEKGGVRPCSGS